MECPPSSPPRLLPGFVSKGFKIFQDDQETGLPSPLPTSDREPVSDFGRVLSSEPDVAPKRTALKPLNTLTLAPDTPLLVGRSSRCHYVLRSSSKLVSRIHARVSYESATDLVTIECLGWNGLSAVVPGRDGPKEYPVVRNQTIYIERTLGIELVVQKIRTFIEVPKLNETTEDESEDLIQRTIDRLSAPPQEESVPAPAPVAASPAPQLKRVRFEPPESPVRENSTPAQPTEALAKAPISFSEYKKRKLGNEENTAIPAPHTHEPMVRTVEASITAPAGSMAVAAPASPTSPIQLSRPLSPVQELEAPAPLVLPEVPKSVKEPEAAAPVAPEQVSEPVAEPKEPEPVMEIEVPEPEEPVQAQEEEREVLEKPKEAEVPEKPQEVEVPVAPVAPQTPPQENPEPKELAQEAVEPVALPEERKFMVQLNLAKPAPVEAEGAQKVVAPAEPAGEPVVEPAAPASAPETVALEAPAPKPRKQRKSAARKPAGKPSPAAIEAPSNNLLDTLINCIAFSRLNSTPLGQVSEVAPQVSREQITSMLTSTDCIGVIQREGKDALGKPLDPEYYYVGEFDTNPERTALISQSSRKSLRACRRSHKQYFYKKPK